MLDGLDINVAQEMLRKDREVWTSYYRFGEFDLINIKELEILSAKANSILVQYREETDRDMVCLHEVLKHRGRIIMDLDIEGSTLSRLYFLFPKRLGNSYIPEGFTEAIENLIIRTLEGIDPGKAAIMRRPKVQWDIDRWASEARPFCWTSACRPGKISMHLTIPLYMANMTGCLGQLRTFYNLINEEARNDPCFAWLNGEPLMDMNLCNLHHQLRLPWQCRRNHNGDSRHIHKYLEKGYGWLHAISGLQPIYIPEEYHIDLGYMHIHPFLQYTDGRKSMGYDASDIEIGEEDVLGILEGAGIDLASRGYEGVISHPRSHPTQIGWRLKKNGSQDCICCGRIHEHTSNTPVICASESRFYLHCFQDRSTNFTLCRRNGKEEKVMARARMLEEAKTIYRRDMLVPNTVGIHSPTLEGRYEIDWNSRLLMIRSVMGTGKSTQVRRILGMRPEWSVLIIGTHRAHSEEMSRDYKHLGFSYYRDDGDDWKSAKRLVVELESLHHVIRSQYDLVLLDEGTAICKLFMSPTMSGKELTTWNKMETYMKRSMQTICMGADLPDYVIKIMSWILRGRSQQLVINSYKVSEDHPRIVYEYSSEPEFLGKVLNDSRNLFFVTTRAGIAIDIAKRLLAKGTKVLLQIGKDKMHKAIAKHKLSENVVKDPDSRLWDQYRVVIITPAILNGISFVKPHFHALYIYASRDGCDVDDVIQMSHRSRIFLDSDVHMYINNSYPRCGYGPMYYGEICSYMDYGTRHWLKTDKKDRILSLASTWNMANMNLKYAIMMSMARSSASRRFMGELLKDRMFEDLGWTVIPSIYDGPKVDRKDPMPSLPVVELSPEVKAEIQRDIDIFHTFVDQNWDLSQSIYDSLWNLGEASRRMLESTCRMVQIDRAEKEIVSILGQSGAVDGLEAAALDERKKVLESRIEKWSISCPGAKPKLQCWEDLQKMGGVRNEGDILILTFDSSITVKDEWKTIIGRIGMLWPKGYKSLQSRNVWSALQHWLGDDLLFSKVERQDPVQGKARQHIYKLHLDTWIGSHVVYR